MIHKTPAASKTIRTEVVCSSDTNPMGILQGGRLVQWMDIAAAVCAQTHAEMICVTAAINQVTFVLPAFIGDIIIIEAKITRSFTSSMEIFVEAYARKIESGKKHLISKAWFSFVGIDGNKKAPHVPSVNPFTLLEKQQYRLAFKRREYFSSNRLIPSLKRRVVKNAIANV